MRNQEGYIDLTAGNAIKSIQKEEKESNKRVGNVISMLKQIISLAGFELVGRIELKDRYTGKIYR